MTRFESLMHYASCHLNLPKEEREEKKNLLLSLLDGKANDEMDLSREEIEKSEYPDDLLIGFSDEKKSKIMGFLTPSYSQVIFTVDQLEAEEKGKGLDYLYHLEIRNGYIHQSALKKNVYYHKTFSPHQRLEIVINNAKPEKDNQKVSKLLELKTNQGCPLCEHAHLKDKETNLRYYPLKLNGEDWYLQFSPYSYVSHHITLIDGIHQNMKITERTFLNLLSFVERYPMYYLGSNTGMPIVGGSLVNHNHYQGGIGSLPIFDCEDLFVVEENERIKISVVDWNADTIKLVSQDKDLLLKKMNFIYETWKNMDEPKLNLLSHTGETEHNTLIPLVRKKNDFFEVYLTLRNNRTNEEYPDGIFHSHKEHQGIKKEGIALFEVSGLFILPSRLNQEFERITEILQQEKNPEESFTLYPELQKQELMIRILQQKLCSETKLNDCYDAAIDICRDILKEVSIYKTTEQRKKLLDL